MGVQEVSEPQSYGGSTPHPHSPEDFGDVIMKVVDALKLVAYGIAILAVDLAMVFARKRRE
jgi:hypothetical protein